jgi:hypothetical protein
MGVGVTWSKGVATPPTLRKLADFGAKAILEAPDLVPM